MARIVMKPEDLAQLLMGELVSIQGTQVLLEADWDAVFGALATALSTLGLTVVLEGKEDWELGDQLASVDLHLPIISRLAPELGGTLQHEAFGIATISIQKIIEQATGDRKPVAGAMLLAGIQLPEVLCMMWLHGFSNGHDFVRDFGAMTEIDLDFPEKSWREDTPEELPRVSEEGE